MSFSLDTSSIIWALRFAYPRANFPTLWEGFEALIRDGQMRASSMVLVELERIEDELLEWARTQEALFIELDRPQQESVRAVVAEFPGLVPAVEDRINADPFVIALAMRDGSTVISQERIGKPRHAEDPQRVCGPRRRMHQLRAVHRMAGLGVLIRNGHIFRAVVARRHETSHTHSRIAYAAMNARCLPIQGSHTSRQSIYLGGRDRPPRLECSVIAIEVCPSKCPSKTRRIARSSAVKLPHFERERKDLRCDL